MATESNLPLKKLGPNRIAFFKDAHQPLQIFAGHFGIADVHKSLSGSGRTRECFYRIFAVNVEAEVRVLPRGRVRPLAAYSHNDLKPHDEAITDLNGLAAIISLIRRKNSVHLQDIDNTGSANLSDSTRLLSFRDTSVLQQRDCRVPQRMKSLDRGTSVSHPSLCFYIEACPRQGSNLQPMFFIYVLCY